MTTLHDRHLEPPDDPDTTTCEECGEEVVPYVDKRERTSECPECGHCFYAFDWDSAPGGHDDY